MHCVISILQRMMIYIYADSLMRQAGSQTMELHPMSPFGQTPQLERKRILEKGRVRYEVEGNVTSRRGGSASSEFATDVDTSREQGTKTEFWRF